MKKESRRSFVRKTAAITSGVLATNVTFQSFANVNENKKLKLAVVGCGGRGSGAVVQALNADDNVELPEREDVITQACFLGQGKVAVYWPFDRQHSYRSVLGDGRLRFQHAQV